MQTITCLKCAKEFTDETMPRRGAICFACHLKTIRIGFSHGKEDFHGPTIRERQRETVEGAAKKGMSIEPVGTRWV